jgi:hypothetical protein
MKAATFAFLHCIGLVLLTPSVVLGAPFRHERSGVVIDPPPEWRMEVRNGFAPIYHLRRKISAEDHEEILRKMGELKAHEDWVTDNELDKLLEGQKCSVIFYWEFSSQPRSYQHFSQINFIGLERIKWEKLYTVISAEQFVTGSTKEVRFIGDFKRDPGTRVMRVYLIGPRSSVEITCGASQAKFKKLHLDLAAIVRGITLPE